MDDPRPKSVVVDGTTYHRWTQDADRICKNCASKGYALNDYACDLFNKGHTCSTPTNTIWVTAAKRIELIAERLGEGESNG